MSEDTVWCNLVRNENKNAENQPDWVGPPNLKSPEGKNWTIGVKIGDVWHNQAGWNELDEQGVLVMINHQDHTIKGFKANLIMVINTRISFN